MNTPNAPHQQEIDAAAVALLRLSPEEAELAKARAWQIAKDSGLDDWRLALDEAMGPKE